MSTRLYRLALLVSRNAGLVVLVWSFLAVSLVGGAIAFGGQFENDYSIPGTESQAGIEALEARFPGTTGATADLVISAPSGASVTDPAARAAIGGLVDDLNALDIVFNAQDPFADPAAGTISTDGRYALSQIQLVSPAVGVDASVISELEATVATASWPPQRWDSDSRSRTTGAPSQAVPHGRPSTSSPRPSVRDTTVRCR